MGIKPEDFSFEHTKEETIETKKDGNKKGPHKQSRKGTSKLKVETRDVLLLLVFVVVVVAMLSGQLSVERGIWALLVAGGALTISQYAHGKRSNKT